MRGKGKAWPGDAKHCKAGARQGKGKARLSNAKQSGAKARRGNARQGRSLARQSNATQRRAKAYGEIQPIARNKWVADRSRAVFKTLSEWGVGR